MNITKDMRQTLDFFSESLKLVTRFQKEALRRAGFEQHYLGLACRNRDITEVDLSLLIADIKTLAALYELKLNPMPEPAAHRVPSVTPLQCNRSLAEYVDELARRSETNRFAEEAYQKRDSSSTIEARRVLDIAACGPNNLREICWAIKGAYHKLSIGDGPFQNILHRLEGPAGLARPRTQDSRERKHG